ncbi:MAG: FAD-dependent oxidoreductase [Clostridia bacterium]|nr:FAD-dependent oxidoreductase [Clostridia bacterium]
MKKNWLVVVLLLIIIALLGLNLYFLYDNNRREETVNDSNDILSGDGGMPEVELVEPPSIEDTNPEVIVKEEVENNETEDLLPVEGEYDVIVFGAEPEGIAASISAARNNLKVLLLEKRDGPGGMMTYAMLNTIDMNTDANGELLSKGIFEEFFKNIGENVSFDVEEVKEVFDDMLSKEKNIEVKYNVKEYSIGSNGTSIEYVIVDGKKYVANSYIDCTQDADITVMAGGEYVIGWEDVNEKNRTMSATLVIHMDNVDWNEACEAIRKENKANTGYTADSIWAFGDRTSKYVPRQTNIRLKALNIGKQKDGSVLINSLQIINADMLDADAKNSAYEKCKKEANYLSDFIIKNIPGFENAQLVGVAPELYVRETRHIVGENRLTVKDILESTYYTNSIGMASYPIDVQTTSIYDYGYIIGNPKQYYLRMGTIIPKGFTNLLTVGRSSSYTSIAAGSARVIPTGMTLGESAGIMAAVAKEEDIDFQQMLADYKMVRNVQHRMSMQKMYLVKDSQPVVDVNGRYYSYIIEMCEKGILSLGYQNTFNPEETMSEREFIIFLQTYLKRSFLSEEYWNVTHINLLDASEKPITPNRAKEIMADIVTYNVKDNKIKENLENYINIVMPIGDEELTLVRIYEISTLIKDYISGL